MSEPAEPTNQQAPQGCRDRPRAGGGTRFPFGSLPRRTAAFDGLSRHASPAESPRRGRQHVARGGSPGTGASPDSKPPEGATANPSALGGAASFPAAQAAGLGLDNG